MMSSIDLLNSCEKIYMPTFFSYPKKEVGGMCSVALSENDPAAKLRSITISNVPEHSILLNLHRYEKLNIGNRIKSIIRDDCGAFKCCDYLLIAAGKGKSHLKTTFGVKSETQTLFHLTGLSKLSRSWNCYS